MTDGIGLSVGATNLTAVVVGRTAVTRSPVLTLYPHRPSEVGVPSENPNLNERGLILTDFVDRVGDPVGILAPDGSSHRGEMLVADALGALLHTVTRGGPAADPVAITHPAHWRPNQVAALRSALDSVAEFRDPAAPTVLSDATAALTALQDNPGVPTRGVIALCDFGGTGTSITLADAGNGYQPIAPTVRHTDLSGDLIDQALLTHIVNELSSAGTIDLASTSAIGSLARLRGECRRAKERLSTESVTSLVAELPGHRSTGASAATGRITGASAATGKITGASAATGKIDVRLNRRELDDAMQAPLNEFIAVLQDTVDRNGLRPGDLVAVATIGGGARIPAVTTALSQSFRVPVITAAQPELTAAIGSGLTAVRGTVEEGMTALATASAAAPPTRSAAALVPEPPPASQALAWSDADDVPDVAPAADFSYEPPEPARIGLTSARPQLEFGEAVIADHDRIAAPPWYRRPAILAGAGGAVVLAAVVAVVLVSQQDTAKTLTPASTSTGMTTTSAPAPAPASDVPAGASAPEQQQQSPQTVIEQAPAETVTQTAPPPADAPPPPQTADAPPPAPPTTTDTPAPTTTAPATTDTPPTTQTPWSPVAPYPTVPGLPWVPAPGGGRGHVG
jgi:hypothetical protein